MAFRCLDSITRRPNDHRVALLFLGRRSLRALLQADPQTESPRQGSLVHRKLRPLVVPLAVELSNGIGGTFQVHQGTMVTAWVLTLVAFVVIFLRVDGWSTYTAHAVVGCITTGESNQSCRAVCVLTLSLVFFCLLFVLSVARNKKQEEYLKSTV